MSKNLRFTVSTYSLRQRKPVQTSPIKHGQAQRRKQKTKIVAEKRNEDIIAHIQPDNAQHIGISSNIQVHSEETLLLPEQQSENVKETKKKSRTKRKNGKKSKVKENSVEDSISVGLELKQERDVKSNLLGSILDTMQLDDKIVQPTEKQPMNQEVNENDMMVTDNMTNIAPTQATAVSSGSGAASDVGASFTCGTLTRKADRIENQDSFTATTHSAQSTCIWAVYDGHGPLGARASNDAARLLKDLITKGITRSTDADEATKILKEDFNTVNQQLLRSSTKSKCEYGTTACVVVMCSKEKRPALLAANVGDSRAIIGRLGTKGYEVIPLSRDHKLSYSDEYDRVVASGGVIHKGRLGGSRVIPNPNDYPELVVKKQQLALNMSRSMGHVILGRYGVSAEPEFCTEFIQPNDILVVASDGLWDAMSNEEVIELASLQKDTKQQCKLLGQEVEKRCTARTMAADNLTIVIVNF